MDNIAFYQYKLMRQTLRDLDDLIFNTDTYDYETILEHLWQIIQTAYGIKGRICRFSDIKDWPHLLNKNHERT